MFVPVYYLYISISNFHLVIVIIVLKAPKPVSGGITDLMDNIGEMEWFKSVDQFILTFDLAENISSTSKKYLLEDMLVSQHQINSTENQEKFRKNFSAIIVVSYNFIG